MKRKHFAALLALVLVFALALTGCAKEEPAAPAEDKTLGVREWDLDAYAWSSNNGATVSVQAEPNYYAEGMTARLVVRMEGEDVENVECQWDNGLFCGEADLNAADGFCYYLVLTSEAGETLELELNTPVNPTDEKLINVKHSLETYCQMAVEEHNLNGQIFTIVKGSVQIRLPEITRDGDAAACQKAELVLYHNDEEVERRELTLPVSGDVSDFALEGINFNAPQMEDDAQLRLTLEATLTDGQVLTGPGGTWFYNDGQLLSAVG